MAGPRRSKPPQVSFAASEWALISHEMGMHFGEYPTLADGIFLRTWRGGPQKDQPKIPPAVRTMMDRGLVEIRNTARWPRGFFTEAGLLEFRRLLLDRRWMDPARFAHLRRELGAGFRRFANLPGGSSNRLAEGECPRKGLVGPSEPDRSLVPDLQAVVDPLFRGPSAGLDESVFGAVSPPAVRSPHRRGAAARSFSRHNPAAGKTAWLAQGLTLMLRAVAIASCGTTAPAPYTAEACLIDNLAKAQSEAAILALRTACAAKYPTSTEIRSSSWERDCSTTIYEAPGWRSARGAGGTEDRRRLPHC